MIKSVVVDIGETLLDDTREFAAWADWIGVPRHRFSAVLGFVWRGTSRRSKWPPCGKRTGFRAGAVAAGTVAAVTTTVKDWVGYDTIHGLDARDGVQRWQIDAGRTVTIRPARQPDHRHRVRPRRQ